MSKYVVNLSKGFKPFESDEVVELIPTKDFVFNDNTPHIEFKEIENLEIDKVLISTRIKDPHWYVRLAMTVQILRHINADVFIYVLIPHFPGGRQDRRNHDGDPLTVKLYADLLNNLKLTKVLLFDPHSPVTEAVVNNALVDSNIDLFETAILDIKRRWNDYGYDYVYVCPDAGAQKKFSQLPIGAQDKVVYCTKYRDTDTGKLSNFKMDEQDLTDCACIIVDDICDGGGTFVQIAKLLLEHNAAAVILIVSHGIFSKGFKPFHGYIKEIHTTDSFYNNISMEVPEIEKGSEMVRIHKFADIT